jgi:hypothetical protein
VSLPSNSAGVDEEQEPRQLDESTRTAAAASSSSGVLDDMLRDRSSRSLESLQIKRLSPRRYACLFRYRHALQESSCEYCLLLLTRLHRRRFCKWPLCLPYFYSTVARDAHTHTHTLCIYIYTYIYTHTYVYILVYMPFSMCEALEMDEIRKVFCMCHELRF